MNWLTISSLDQARVRFAAAKITHAISFKDRSCAFPDLDGVVDPSNWLKFNMADSIWDSRKEQYKVASGFVQTIIDWSRELPVDARLGVNCLMGQSRSTAGALIAAVAREGFERGTQTWWSACDFTPTPNAMLVEIGDQLLGLDDKLVDFTENLAERFLIERVRPVSGALIGPNVAPDDEIDAMLREYGLHEDLT